jgi:hypothetical protein
MSETEDTSEMTDTDEPIKVVGRTQVLPTAYVWNDDGKSIRLMTEEEIAAALCQANVTLKG